MFLLKIDPHSRVNDHYLDGSLPYTMPDQDLCPPLMQPTKGHPNFVYINADFEKHVALDVVSETVFNYPYPFISEKTLRPIFNKRMFIIVGAAGVLKTLQRYGFETWGDFIDETYDTVSEPNTRLKLVLEEVRKFCSRDLDEIRQYMHDNQQRLEHNHQVFRELRDRELPNILATIKG